MKTRTVPARFGEGVTVTAADAGIAGDVRLDLELVDPADRHVYLTVEQSRALRKALKKSERAAEEAGA